MTSAPAPATAPATIGLSPLRSVPNVEFDPLPIDLAVLRSLLDCSADSVSVIGRDGAARFVTPRGLEQFGATDRSQVIGQPWLDQWPDACAKVLAGALGQALAGQRTNCDIRCENDRGEASWWEVCFSPWNVGAMDDRSNLVIAVARDVSDRHAAIENAELLARELHHRVGNMLSMVQAIVRISAKAHRDPKHFIDSVEERVDALARAHSLLTIGRQGEAALRSLLLAELAPFAETGRVSLDGPLVIIREPAASALCLAIHELTSNAVKYGALSCSEGQLCVSWRADAGGGSSIRWIEHANRPVSIGPSGFGTMLLGYLLNDQLRVDRKWRDEGLVATITLVADMPSAN